jgi:hypothetical protein
MDMNDLDSRRIMFFTLEVIIKNKIKEDNQLSSYSERYTFGDYQNYWKRNPKPIMDDGDNDWQDLIKLTDQIANLDFSNVRKYFSGEESGKIEEIVDDLRNAERIYDLFIDSKYTDSWYLSKGLDIKDASEQLDEFLVKRQKLMYSQFTATLIDLEENKFELLRSQEIRAKLDQIVGEFNVAYNVSRKRGLELVSDKVKQEFSEYQERRESMKSVDEEIDKLTASHSSLSDYENQRELLKRLRKKTKSKGGSKSQLVKESKRIGFYEGVIKLNRLEQEVINSQKSAEVTKVRNEVNGSNKSGKTKYGVIGFILGAALVAGAGILHLNYIQGKSVRVEVHQAFVEANRYLLSELGSCLNGLDDKEDELNSCQGTYSECNKELEENYSSVTSLTQNNEDLTDKLNGTLASCQSQLETAQNESCPVQVCPEPEVKVKQVIKKVYVEKDCPEKECKCPYTR